MSVLEASKKYNIKSNNIVHCLLDPRTNTAGGYHWKYIKDLSPEDNNKKYQPKNKTNKIYCIETGLTFDTLIEAERYYNIQHIGECCKGKRKTAGGYHWKYM